MNKTADNFSLEKIKHTFEVLKNRINMPKRAEKENNTNDFYHNPENGDYLSFISSISDMYRYFGKENDPKVLERDLNFFHDQRKILHNDAARNICTVIEYFNQDFIADRKLKDFTDKTEEYQIAVMMAAQEIDLILPMYQKIAVKAAFYSPFDSVKEIAMEIFSNYDHDQITNFYAKEQQFVKEIKDYMRENSRKKQS